MDVQTLIDRAGSVSKLAAALGIAHNTVSDWKRTGFIPGSRLGQISVALDLPVACLIPLVRPAQKRSIAA